MRINNMEITIIDGKKREENQDAIRLLMEKGFKKQADILKKRYSTNTTLPDVPCIISVDGPNIKVIRNRYGETTDHGVLDSIVHAYLSGDNIEWKVID